MSARRCCGAWPSTWPFAMDAEAMAATVPDAIHGVSKILLHGKPYSLKKMKNAVFTAYEHLKAASVSRCGQATSTKIIAFSPRGCWP